MKKLIFAISLIAIMALGASLTDTYNQPKPIKESTCFADSSIFICPSGAKDFCSELPKDVANPNNPDRKYTFGYSTVLSPDAQPGFDEFSWQMFIGLNFPADDKGKALDNFMDSPDAKRVWEWYEDVDKVMELEPKLFSTHENILNDKNTKLFYMFSKDEDGELHAFQQADGYPLIDKNLNFVVFEQKMNPDQAAYIRSNSLDSKAGIKAFYDKNNYVQLPPNKMDRESRSQEIKASWRILEIYPPKDSNPKDYLKNYKPKKDSINRYYTKDAKIVIKAENSLTGKPFSIMAKVGLVGMHIVSKVKEEGNWVWSTFEHEDNVPDDLQAAQQSQNPDQWSFYNPKCLGCTPNKPIQDFNHKKDKVMWSETPPFAQHYAKNVPVEHNKSNLQFGSQVTRTYPIYYCTEDMNTLFREKLKTKKSVFQHYRLIGTQWNTSDPGVNRSNAPTFLANTTAETFMQDSSSCIGCHNLAGITYMEDEKKIRVKTDFSFALSDAK